MSEDTSGVTVVTIPPPTVNGALHVGHLSGPYLAADIAARAAKARGEKVLAVAGLDVAQNYIATCAELEGLDAGPMMARFRSQILDAFHRGRIHYDVFVDTQERCYEQAIAGMVADLVERGSIPMRSMTLHACGDCGRTLHHSYVSGTCPGCGSGASGGSCEVCGGFTSAQNLGNPSCDRCGGAPRPFVATVPVLRIEDYRDELMAAWVQAELPRRARDLIAHNLASGLPEIPLAYPTNWGIEGTGPLAGMRIDPYPDMGLSWLYGVGRAFDPSAETLDACLDAWRGGVKELWQFHGIDNTFYFAIFWPALFAAAGLSPAPLRGLVVNEFYTLDGKKFSTSRNHAIWAHDFLAAEDPGIVRLFLAWDRPDRYSTDFTRESFEAFRNRVSPMLSGDSTPSRLPAALVSAERARGEQALQLAGFDPAMAARTMLSLLAAGPRAPGPILTALTGAEVE